MISKSDTEKLLSRLTEGEKHRKEVKSCRTEHRCYNPDCPHKVPINDTTLILKTKNPIGIIRVGEPAVVITYIINNPNTNKEIYTTKYYHVTCEPK